MVVKRRFHGRIDRRKGDDEFIHAEVGIKWQQGLQAKDNLEQEAQATIGRFLNTNMGSREVFNEPRSHGRGQ